MCCTVCLIFSLFVTSRLLNTSHNGATTASSDFQGKHYLELLDVVVCILWDKDFVTVLLLVGLIQITVK